MTDDWARPSDGTDRGAVVEVPLIGDEFETAPNPDDPPVPNWRRAVGIALAGGLIGGTVLSFVLVTLDDEPADDGLTTTVAPDDLSSLITTPPTLDPLTPLPLPDDPAFAAIEESPQPTTSQERTLFEPGPVPPTYPPSPGAYENQLGEYDIEQAVALLGEDVPRRSRTHVELGAAGYVIDVTILRDPERDRYHVTLDSRGQIQTAIVDAATETTYVNVGTDNRIDVPNEEIFAGSDAATINEYFDRLMLGPLRPDTIAAATTQGRDLVMIDVVGLARRFVTTIPGSLIPEWQLYAFSPVFEFPVEDRPSKLDYFAYVDENGDVVQVDGIALIGDVTQFVQHRIERLDPPEVIDLAIGTATTIVTVPVTVPVITPADG